MDVFADKAPENSRWRRTWFVSRVVFDVLLAFLFREYRFIDLLDCCCIKKGKMAADKRLKKIFKDEVEI